MEKAYQNLKKAGVFDGERRRNIIVILKGLAIGMPLALLISWLFDPYGFPAVFFLLIIPFNLWLYRSEERRFANMLRPEVERLIAEHEGDGETLSPLLQH